MRAPGTTVTPAPAPTPVQDYDFVGRTSSDAVEAVSDSRRVSDGGDDSPSKKRRPQTRSVAFINRY